MIPVARGPKPRVLIKNEVKWLAMLKSATTPAARERTAKKYRNVGILQSLNTMFHGKCAYCESQIRHVDYPHVEHFHPRKGPRGNEDLTFDWDNLLLACAVCNGPQYKSVKFPGPDEGGPILNPCRDNPDDHLIFTYDPATKLALVEGKTDRGSTSEHDLGLNRLELLEHRSRQVTRIAAIARLASSDPEAAALLAESKDPKSEYSRFAKLF